VLIPLQYIGLRGRRPKGGEKVKREKIYRIDEKTTKRESELTDKEKEYKDALRVEDELFEDDEGRWLTWRSIVEEVSKRWRPVNLDNDTEVEQWLLEWERLPWHERIRYGKWGPTTKEYKAQQLMQEGVPPEEAIKEAGL